MIRQEPGYWSGNLSDNWNSTPAASKAPPDTIQSYSIVLRSTDEMQAVVPEARGIALFYHVQCLTACILPSPSVFGNFDAYGLLALHPDGVTHILNLVPTVDNKVWAGSCTTNFLRELTSTGIQVQVTSVNTGTKTVGQVILSGMLHRFGDSVEEFSRTFPGLPVPSRQTTTRLQGHDINTQHAKNLKNVSTGCIPCAKAHLIAILADLEEALRFAREEGINSPEVELRLTAAQKEILALERYDLSPGNLQKTPIEQRKVIRRYLPAIRSLRQKLLNHIHTAEDLEQIAAEFDILYHQFKRELGRL